MSVRCAASPAPTLAASRRKPHLARLIASALILLDGSRSLAADSRDGRVSLNATAGLAFDGGPLRFALVETSADVTSRLTLAAAVAYVGADEGYEDLQLRALATGTITARRWIIQSRHLFSQGTESGARYRTRLRVVRPGLLGQESLSLRSFYELYLDLDRGRLLRNNLALGVATQPSRRVGAELYHVWVDERRAPARNYVLVLVTWRIQP